MDDDIDSSCSTPFASAPSSPGRPHAIGIGGGGGYFFSAPASPIHHLLLSSSCSASATPTGAGGPRGSAGDAEFEFGGPGGPMISADELFHNGQIRPLTLPPLPDLDPGSDDDDGDCGGRARGRDLTPRSASVHRRARSMSPLRTASPRLKLINALVPAPDLGPGPAGPEATGGTHGEAAPPVTASSRSSSSSSTSSSSSGTSSARGSRRWVFIRDMLLHRSKSEPASSSSSTHTRDAGPGAAPAAGATSKSERAWPFSPAWVARDRLAARLRPSRAPPATTEATAGGPGGGEDARPRAQGRGRRRRSTTVAAAHERLYAAPNRAQAEEMRRRTFLPYRQGLLGCLGFSSRGYGALHGLTKTLNPVFSR